MVVDDGEECRCILLWYNFHVPLSWLMGNVYHPDDPYFLGCSGWFCRNNCTEISRSLSLPPSLSPSFPPSLSLTPLLPSLPLPFLYNYVCQTFGLWWKRLSSICRVFPGPPKVMPVWRSLAEHTSRNQFKTSQATVLSISAPELHPLQDNHGPTDKSAEATFVGGAWTWQKNCLALLMLLLVLQAIVLHRSQLMSDHALQSHIWNRSCSEPAIGEAWGSWWS